MDRSLDNYDIVAEALKIVVKQEILHLKVEEALDNGLSVDDLPSESATDAPDRTSDDPF